MTVIYSEPEVKYSNKASRVNELYYLLKCDAEKNKMVEQLIIEREAAIKDAYNFTYGVVKWDIDQFNYPSRTENVVEEILALKEYYQKRIMRCEIKHKRFKEILEQIPFNDAEVLLKAFCSPLEVDVKEVKKVIRSNIHVVGKYYT